MHHTQGTAAGAGEGQQARVSNSRRVTGACYSACRYRQRQRIRPRRPLPLPPDALVRQLAYTHMTLHYTTSHITSLLLRLQTTQHSRPSIASHPPLCPSETQASSSTLVLCHNIQGRGRRVARRTRAHVGSKRGARDRRGRADVGAPWILAHDFGLVEGHDTTHIQLQGERGAGQAPSLKQYPTPANTPHQKPARPLHH